MNVFILCGGQGVRMREETEYRPRPMFEVGPSDPFLATAPSTEPASGPATGESSPFG